MHISGKLLLLDIIEICYLFFQTNCARLYFVARTFRNMQSQFRFWLNFVKLGTICTVILSWFLILTKWWWRNYKSNFSNEFVEMFFKIFNKWSNLSQSNFVDLRHKWVKWCNFKKKQLVFASVLYLHFNFLKQIKPVLYNFYVFEILRCENDMEKSQMY